MPDFEAGATNIEGEYLAIADEDFYKTESKKLTPQTVFLCRNTAPLTKAAFRLLGQGIACYVEGKDIGADIIDLVNRWASVKTLRILRERLQAYLEQQTEKLTKAGKDRQVESLNDRIETVFAVIEGLPKGATLDDLKAKVDELFQKTPKGEKPNRIRLMSIHRSRAARQDRGVPRSDDLDPVEVCQEAQADRAGGQSRLCRLKHGCKKS